MRGGVCGQGTWQICFRRDSCAGKKKAMQTRDPEDQFIRSLIILGAAGAVVGLLTVATIVTVLVSANFNILNWME